MKRSVTLQYGADKLTLNIDDEFLQGDVIRPRATERQSRDELMARIRGALRNPIDSKPLCEIAAGKTVSVVVSDEFRAGLHELIIEALSEELAEAKPRHVTFCCATGSHPPAVYTPKIERWVHQYAQAAGLPYAFHGHDCEQSRHVDLGHTPKGTPALVDEAFLRGEVRVFGHECKHHYMNGYSVIDKQVLPGVSGRRTIELNHKRSLSDDSGPGRNPWHHDPRRQVNPMGEDARDLRAMTRGAFVDEAGRLHRDHPVTEFGLDMISDKDAIFWVGAGDPAEVTRRAVRYADEQAQFVISPTRYVLISPGGPPASQALYGVQNCFDMALLGAIQDGGEALIVAPCEGRPDLPDAVRGLATDEASLRLFWHNVIRLANTPLAECLRDIEDNFELYMWKAYRVLRLQKKNRVKLYLASRLAPEKLAGSGIEAVADPQAWLDERAARGDGRLTAIDNGNKLLVIGE